MRGHIRLERVSFRYRMDGQRVLEGVELDIPAGQVVGVVGVAEQGGPGGGLFEQEGALEDFAAQLREAGLKLDLKLVLPSAEGVAPCFDGELVPHVSKKGAFPAPTVVSIWNGLHGRVVPIQGTEGAPL